MQNSEFYEAFLDISRWKLAYRLRHMLVLPQIGRGWSTCNYYICWVTGGQMTWKRTFYAFCQPILLVYKSIPTAVRKSFLYDQVNTNIRDEKIQIWKEVVNPFITHWDEQFAEKEKCVVNICLHVINSDRAGRSPELLSVLSTGSYFTLTSVARKDIIVRFSKANFVKAKV